MDKSRYKYQQVGVEGHPVKVAESGKWQLLWRGINVVMVIFFLLSSLVQINDPDPGIWIPAYVTPALLSLAVVVNPAVTLSTWWRMVTVAHMALCLAGSIYLGGVVVEHLSKKVVNPLLHEEGRELGGLIVIMTWLGICRFSKLGTPDAERGSMHALLLAACILGLLPLAIWGLCFVDGFTTHLSHCKDMFKGGIFSRAVVPDH